MVLTQQEIIAFQEKIFAWWNHNKRDLPWRRTFDPYNIMISEIMLQQTQVFRALPKYVEFIETYPSIFELAHAKTSDVIRLWKGLGYNRRALYLKKCAEIIVELHNGIFPYTEKDILALPGIGKYTARAILVFAFKKDITMVDTNIRQIITNEFFDGIPQKESIIQCVADQLLPKGKSWEWHQALMDYNAICLSKSQVQSSIRQLADKVQKKDTIPFKQTKRYIRGKIMDAVREQNWKEKLLIEEFIFIHDRSEKELKEVINSLISEGLLVRVSNVILTLPE